MVCLAWLVVPPAVEIETVGGTVSRVKLRALTPETLPAASVWRTRTVLRPSTGVNDVVQVVPPLLEDSTVAPLSIPERDSAPTFVMWSLFELPLSVVSAAPGGAGGVWSTVRFCEAGGAAV